MLYRLALTSSLVLASALSVQAFAIDRAVLAQSAAGNTNFEVGLLVERPITFTPGIYTYVVTLTIAP